MRRQLLDRLYASDFGLRRFRAARAATATTFVTVVVLIALAELTGEGLGLVVPGVLLTAVSTMAPGLDADPGHRRVSMLLAPLAGVAGLAVGAWVTGRPVLTATVFIVLVVVTLGAAMTGPRGIVLGLTAIVVFYGTDLVGVAFADAGIHAIAVLIAGAVALLMLGVVFQDDPRTDPPRIVRSVLAQADRVLWAVENGASAEAESRFDHLRTCIARARAHVEAHPTAWPMLLRAESGAVLSRLEGAVRHDLDVSGDGESSAQARHRIQSAFDAAQAGGAAAVDADEGPAHIEGLEPARAGRSQVSMAVQLLVATVLSLVVSMAIDQDRWFWGVLAALVMLFGTSSVSDALGKGIRRTLGTAAALPVGVLLAAAVDGSPWSIVPCMVGAMFLQQYFADVAYAVSVFFLTIFLSLVFDLTGSGSEVALAVRLVETGAGAAVGAAVAVLVMPTRTAPLLRARASDVLVAARVTLELVAAGRPTSETEAARHQTQQRFHALVEEALQSRRGWPFSPAHRSIERQVDAAWPVLRELEAVVDAGRARLTDDQIAQIRAAVLDLDSVEARIVRGPATKNGVRPGATPAEGDVANALARFRSAVATLSDAVDG